MCFKKYMFSEKISVQIMKFAVKFNDHFKKKTGDIMRYHNSISYEGSRERNLGYKKFSPTKISSF